MKLKTVKQIKNLRGKRVLLRVDFNVPLKNGKVLDDFRIKSGLLTIKYLLNQGASVIILNHLGRPKGKVVKKLSNRPIAERLSKLLKKKVSFVNGVIGPKVIAAVKSLSAGKVIMLENVRFLPGEAENSRSLAKILASYGDLFVNDAFAACHRQSSSISAITSYLPAVAGLLLESEINRLSRVLESKIKPKTAIIGGAKFDTKIAVIKNLLKKMDYVLVGGAIANNFLKAKGLAVGKSLVDDALLGAAKKMLCKKLLVPIDAVVAKKISLKSKSAIKSVNQISQSDIILDIGPKTIQQFSAIIKKSKLIVWNGPLGYFEIPQYKKSSEQITRSIIKSKAESIIGGGETIQLIRDSRFAIRDSYISTGGGAMLEFLAGRLLSGIKPLIDKRG